MNKLIIDIALLIITIVYIVDYSGVIVDISKFLHKITHKGEPWMGQIIRKPFSCSECLTFWTALGLSLYNIDVIPSLIVATTAAISSKLIKKLMGLLISLINKIK